MTVRLTELKRKWLLHRAKRRIDGLRLTFNDEMLSKCERKAVRELVRELHRKQERR